MPSNPPAKPILLTGASGALGRVLAKALGERGWALRLTDRAPFPDPLPSGASFTLAGLEDGPSMLRLSEGCGAILHFGGISDEQPFETVIGPNIRGTFHAYEAARIANARMVLASSNHVAGFHERSATLDAACAFRPDGYYGLSKAYGELMGGLYWDKHGVTSVFLRIGSCRIEPADARMLSTWLSYRDLVSLVECSVLADVEGCLPIWGASKNSMTWWRGDARQSIGWAPKDSADAYAALWSGEGGGDGIAERYQGGSFCTIGYSRKSI